MFLDLNAVNWKVLNTLYSKASTGKIKEWTVGSALLANGLCILRKKHGYIDGKKIISDKKINGKNIGRSNETTSYQQAQNEAQSAWQKLYDLGGRETIEEAVKFELILPMLAHKFKGNENKITFPCYVQPKLNGVRCLSIVKDGKVDFKSRKGKSYNETLGHIVQPILIANDGRDWLPDGEIYNHDMTFQEITRRVKKYRPNESEKLQYYIYDIADKTLDFEDRFATIKKLKNDDNIIVKVPTIEVKDFGELKKLHDYYVANGYEGLIIRNKLGKYKLGLKRSYDLLKYKEFIDDEFEITGGTDGSGTDEGCIIFEVKTKDGLHFNVRPRGTVKQRKKWFNDLENLICKYLTVRYQELSEDGTPIFPVGLNIRDYEG